jgi:hypothetical protein
LAINVHLVFVLQSLCTFAFLLSIPEVAIEGKLCLVSKPLLEDRNTPAC